MKVIYFDKWDVRYGYDWEVEFAHAGRKYKATGIFRDTSYVPKIESIQRLYHGRLLPIGRELEKTFKKFIRKHVIDEFDERY